MVGEIEKNMASLQMRFKMNAQEIIDEVRKKDEDDQEKYGYEDIEKEVD